MTEEERQQILGRLVSERHEAKTELGLLEARASQMASDFFDLADALTGGRRAKPDTDRGGFNIGYRDKPLQYPTEEAVADTLVGIPALRERVKTLDQQIADALGHTP